MKTTIPDSITHVVMTREDYERHHADYVRLETTITAMREVISRARYAMCDGNLDKAPVPVDMIAMWLDRIENVETMVVEVKS